MLRTSKHDTPTTVPCRKGALLINLGTASDDRQSSLAMTLSGQAEALTRLLPEGWCVLTAIHTGQPDIGSVVSQIVADGIEELTVVPMHPHFSQATTGAIMQELYSVLRGAGQNLNLTTRTTWFDELGYVSAQARMLAEFAISRRLNPGDAHILFAAHSATLPNSKADATYSSQVRRSAELVADRLGWPQSRVSLSFANRPDSALRLRPDASGDIARLLQAGKRKVILCHLTFPVNCWDLTSDTYGLVDEVHVCPALNAYGPFIAALKSIVLRGPRSVVPSQTAPRPMLQVVSEPETMEDEPKSIVMIGASLANGISHTRGPRLSHSDPDAFAAVKKSRKELFEFLDWVKQQTPTEEGFVWDTCQRIEYYGWLANPDDVAGREWTIAQIRHRLYGNEPDGLAVNILFGAEAWHHLMRTAVGLNSALPGDTDVVAQLQTACRIAERTATAGPRANRLVEEAVEVAQRVRAETTWGRFSTGYCFAALSRLHEVGTAKFAECRHVIIGGSTTSRSVVATLSDHFQVPHRQMTLVYRCNHGQMKLLRSAIGNGKRLRVNSYSERGVIRAIAEADFVFFGIDRPEPVLDATELHGLRDYGERPLRVVDFNSFGSLSNHAPMDGLSIWSAADLDRAVAAHAEIMRARGQFARAVEEAEEWIERHLPVAQEQAPSSEMQDAGNTD